MLVLVVSGNVKYIINDQIKIAEKGDILFIPKSAKRLGENDNSGPHQKYTVLFTVTTAKELGIDYIDKSRFIKVKPKNFEYFKLRFETIYRELRGSENYKSFICYGILQEIIGMIARELEITKSSPMKIKYAKQIQEYLLVNYRKQIVTEDLAKLIQKSPNYTITLFKEVTGETPINYIHKLRILEACNLLLYSKMSVANISDYLGYYDGSYFSKTFKRVTSLSPKEYVEMGIKGDAVSFGEIFKL